MDPDIASISCDDSKQNTVTYCICKSSVSNVFMIMCDFCEEWYHGECVGITLALAEEINIYCCCECQKKDAKLKTSYKTKNFESQNARKTKSKVKRPNKNSGFNHSSNCEVDSIQNCNDASFKFTDTTIRKAKTKAYQKFKTSAIISDRPESSTTEKEMLKQCYGPGCTKASRAKSKYCSDKCGMALASNRILEILPQRIHERTNTTPVADELSKKKLIEIRSNLLKIKDMIESVDIKIIKLIEFIYEAKRPENVFKEINSEDITLFSCALCGMEIQSKIFEKHLEQCYKKADRNIFVTENTSKPDDAQWNIFCNHKISKNMYCKKFKVLCPLHYKHHRKDYEVCGFPLYESNGEKVYCGNIGRTCNHLNWEEKMRAQYDMEKLNLLVKYNALRSEELKIRNEMASRGDLLGLMLHQTIAH